MPVPVTPSGPRAAPGRPKGAGAWPPVSMRIPGRGQTDLRAPHRIKFLPLPDEEARDRRPEKPDEEPRERRDHGPATDGPASPRGRRDDAPRDEHAGGAERQHLASRDPQIGR